MLQQYNIKIKENKMKKTQKIGVIDINKINTQKNKKEWRFSAENTGTKIHKNKKKIIARKQKNNKYF